MFSSLTYFNNTIRDRAKGKKRVTAAFCQSRDCARAAIDNEAEYHKTLAAYHKSENVLEKKRLYRKAQFLKNGMQVRLDTGNMVFVGIVGDDVSRNADLCPKCKSNYLYFKTIILEPAVEEDVRLYYEEVSLNIFNRA